MKTEMIPLLRKGVEWVEEQSKIDLEIREWVQDQWIIDEEQRIDLYGHEHGCGTGMCLAGFLGKQLAPEKFEHDWSIDPELDDHGDRTVAGLVSRELGLSEGEAHYLFHAHNEAKDIRRHAEQIAGERL